MISAKRMVVLAVLVLVGLPELGWGQFQQQMFGPRPSGGGRGRRASALDQGSLKLASSCLEYGVKTPEPTDVFAAVTPGKAFLIGRGPGGRVDKLDLSEAVRSGVAVLRGTGKGDEVLLEVKSPGWSELEILPGCVALPNLVARPVEVPETSLALVGKAAEVENAAAKAIGGGEAVIARVLGQARQEHLWAVRSASWQALNAGADPLQAAIASVTALESDPAAAARVAWVERNQKDGPAAKLNLAFLGDYVVLRLAEPGDGRAKTQAQPGAAQGGARGDLQAALKAGTVRGRSKAALPAGTGMEVCTKDGVARMPLTRTGVQGLAGVLKAAPAGHVVTTEELLAALDKATLTHTLDETLAAAGHAFAAYSRDDDLAAEPFAEEKAARLRFAVIAPMTAAEAKAAFGRNNKSAYAFKGLIEEKQVERVGTAEEIKRLAAGVKADEQLVLVGMEEYGRLALLDGSTIAPAALPTGVSAVIACDTLDAKEVAPVQPLRAGTLTFDALAAGVRSATRVAAVGPMTRTELVEALSAGIQSEWQRQKMPVGPVLKWSRKVNGDVLAVGSAGSLLKVGSVTVAKAGADKGQK